MEEEKMTMDDHIPVQILREQVAEIEKLRELLAEAAGHLQGYATALGHPDCSIARVRSGLNDAAKTARDVLAATEERL